MNRKYKVVAQSSLDAMESTVTEVLSHGWKLQGGISVVLLSITETDISIRYYQAVYKDDEEDQELAKNEHN